VTRLDLLSAGSFWTVTTKASVTSEEPTAEVRAEIDNLRMDTLRGFEEGFLSSQALSREDQEDLVVASRDVANQEITISFRADGKGGLDYGLDPDLPDMELDDGVERRSKWHRYLDSFDSLTNALVVEENAATATLQGSQAMHVQTVLKKVLISMATRIIHSLIRGDLPRQYRSDANIKKVVDEVRRQGTAGLDKDSKQPVLYAQYIVNKDGRGLSREQLQELTQHLRWYCQPQD
jgi:hypothetical protein